MLAVIETAEFQAMAHGIWDTETHFAFVDFIAASPEAGDVVPGSGGCRKVRWQATGRGKRGGSRVIYFNEREHA